MKLDLPFLIEPKQLEKQLGNSNLLIVDVGDQDAYERERIPGAVHIDYIDLVSGDIPASGMLPSTEHLSDVLSAIGMTDEKHVVAYDADFNGRAARFLWTLDVLTHCCSSLLNGGFTAWKNEQHEIDTRSPPIIQRSDYKVRLNGTSRADKDYILSKLGNNQVKLLDARTPLEFEGLDVRAMRGGHIPGASNLNWLDTIDTERNNRLKKSDQLMEMLRQRGLTPEKEIITYCQTHHRSSHSYVMLKALGFKNIRGYPGSWSEWGNSFDTPIE